MDTPGRDEKRAAFLPPETFPSGIVGRFGETSLDVIE
jgi:hypothetical protein